MKEPIACLGAGRMGRGIAVVFAYAGHNVTLVDFKARDGAAFDKLSADALERSAQHARHAREFRAVRSGSSRNARWRACRSWPKRRLQAALSSAAIVFEGVPEVLDLKREALARAVEARRPDADHCVHHIDDSGRRSCRRGRTSRALPQRALAQSGVSRAAGRGLARQADRSRGHQRVKALLEPSARCRSCARRGRATSCRASRRWR